MVGVIPLRIRHSTMAEEQGAQQVWRSTFRSSIGARTTRGEGVEVEFISKDTHFCRNYQ